MAVYFVSGGLGSGKTLAAVGQLKQYAFNRCQIAGNIDLFLEHFADSPRSKVTYTRIPDRPTADDLYALGLGKPEDDYDEENNGLLVLDELATWLNSQSWNEKGRKELRDWFVHARKYGWDIIFLVQSIAAVDSQLLALLMEYHVPMSNMAKINVPIIGGWGRTFKRNGKPFRLPKIHVGRVMYKDLVKADRWIFRARHLYKCYNTKQVISDDYPHGAHCQLSRWHLEGRYLPPLFDWRFLLSFAWRIPLFVLVKLFERMRLIRYCERRKAWVGF